MKNASLNTAAQSGGMEILSTHHSLPLIAFSWIIITTHTDVLCYRRQMQLKPPLCETSEMSLGFTEQ